MKEPIYDKETLKQMRDISQDNKDKEHDKSLSELNSALKDLQNRVHVLEEARKVQIKINRKLLEDEDHVPQISKRWKFWL